MTTERTARTAQPLVEALERLIGASKPNRGWIVYIGDDSASCAFCESYSGDDDLTPYDEDAGERWKHEEVCPVVLARAALAAWRERA